MTILIEPATEIGTHIVEVKAVDSLDTDADPSVYTFSIEIFSFQGSLANGKDASGGDSNDLTPPSIEIGRIDKFGVVTVQFSRPMHVLGNSTYVNETVFELSL